jgi:hypothetical protein
MMDFCRAARNATFKVLDDIDMHLCFMHYEKNRKEKI